MTQLRLVALPVVATLCGGGVAQADVVGAAGAANTRSTGTPPGAGMRTIEIGTQIVHNEKIETSASGSLHIIFIDRTTLNIGPSSTLVIDNYVYNPTTGTGQMAATLSRGVMRIVGGQVTHTGGAQIKTPAATIGVRGGVATVRHCTAVGPGCAQSGTRAINHFGVLTAGSGSSLETISRPGFGTFVAGLGLPPAPAARVPQGEIDQNNRQLTSQAGARGGASGGQRPTDAQAARNGVGDANGGRPPLGPGDAGPPPPADSANNPAQQGAQQQATTTTAAANQKPQTTSNAARAYTLTTTAGAGSNVPFLTASFVGSGNFTVSPVYGYKPENSTLSHVLQTNMGVNGSGASQTSFFSVMTGLLGQPTSGGAIMGGVFVGSSLQSGRGLPTMASGNVSSTGASGQINQLSVDASGVPNSSFGTSQNRIDVNGGVVSTRTATAQSGSTSYTFNQTVSPSTAPSGIGSERSPQSELVMNGYTAGLFKTSVSVAGASPSSSPVFIVSNAGGVQPSTFISLYANGSMSANFQIESYGVGSTGVATPNTGDTANFAFGTDGTGSQDEGHGTYVDTRIFGAVGARRNGSNDSQSGSSIISTVSGHTLAQDGLMMATSDAVNAATLFPNVRFCTCDYTRWGFWSANTSWVDGAGGAVVSNSSNLNLWVTGLPTSAANMPTTGSATYSGHVIANISNNGSQYLAASNMSSQVNFGTGAASLNVSNLDGYQYTGTRAATPGGIPNTFQFTATGAPVAGTTAGGINPIMTGNGGFFASKGDAAGSMAGAVLIGTPNGGSYLGAGIFAAQK